MAQPLQELLYRGCGGPDDERAVPERARGLEQRSASPRGASVHRLANGLRDVSKERTHEKQHPDGAEAPHPLVERTVLRIEEPSLVEVGKNTKAALAAGEPPALASRGQHLP